MANTPRLKTAVMYGAGNIGRGFIGQLFSLSGYQTQFIDINMTLIDKFNADGRYPHYTTAGDHYEKTYVENVSGVDGRNSEAVADAIARCSVMATAIGVNVLKFIGGNIALGLIKRYENGSAPLNIIICENLIGADAYLRGLVYEHLNDVQKAWADQNVGFVEASIGRMVPAVPAELQAENPLSVCVEPFCMLPIDEAACRGGLPQMINLQPYSPFQFFIERKLFLHNMAHAMTSYLGAVVGDTFVWQSAQRPEIKYLTLLAAEESGLALSREHGVEVGELLQNGLELLTRFENQLLGDTIARVGKDTKRKLGRNDRLVGAYLLARKHQIRADAIALGIAAGLRFEGTDDASSTEIAAYAKENGPAAALEKYSGLTAEEEIAPIVRYYGLLAEKSMTELIFIIEQELIK